MLKWTHQARAVFCEMREHLDIARETYGAERDAGQGRVSAGLAALGAAAAKERGERANPNDMRERLAGSRAGQQTRTSARRRKATITRGSA